MAPDAWAAPEEAQLRSISGLESLACGTPAVVSRTSALAEIVTSDSGALADNDPAAIAQAARDIAGRPERHRRVCARDRAEMFTWQRSATGMLTSLDLGRAS